MGKTDITRALAVAMELTGTEMSEAAVDTMVNDLASYPEPQVLAAIERARREVRHKLTLADVISRMDDGRPGVEEAWSLITTSENETTVLTDEIMLAFGTVLPLISTGDSVAARMAFKESYQRFVAEAREEKRPVHWFVSLGHDPSGREAPIRRAMELGRLSPERAQALIPHIDTSERKSVEGPRSVKEIIHDTSR